MDTNTKEHTKRKFQNDPLFPTETFSFILIFSSTYNCTECADDECIQNNNIQCEMLFCKNDDLVCI